MSGNGGATKNPEITRVMCEVVKDMNLRGRDEFTLNTFDHRGISVKTIEYRIDKHYGLRPDWRPQNRYQHKKVYRTMDLIEAMKAKGDWV